MNVCFVFFHSSSKISVSEAVASEPSNPLVSNIQPSKQYEPANNRSDTVTNAIEPREHRRPNRPGIVWAVGGRLQARDFLNKWYV